MHQTCLDKRASALGACPETRVTVGTAQAKPEAGLARRSGWPPGQERGWRPAPRLSRQPRLRGFPDRPLVPDEGGLAGGALPPAGLAPRQLVLELADVVDELALLAVEP